MTYWKFAPGERAFNWQIQRSGNYIGIGWHALGNIIGLSESEYDARRAAQAKLIEKSTFDGHRNVWNFVHSIQIGDIVVANSGLHLIVGIGRVTGSAKYCVDKNSDFPTRRRVNWIYVNDDGHTLPKGQFPQATLAQIQDKAIIAVVDELMEASIAKTRRP